LRQLSSLYADHNQLTDVAPLAKLRSLQSLDLHSNRIAVLDPLQDLSEWKYLFLDDNQVTDLRPLVEMARRDKAGPRRFVSQWSLYLSGNPLSDEARKSQLPELRSLAKSVTF
jgi:internalin A